MTFHTLIRWPVAMETASSSYSKTLRASFVAPWPHTMASEISTVPNLLGCTMVTCGSFPLEWSQFKYIRLGPYLDRHHASIPPLNIGAVKNVGSCWFSVVWPSNFHLYLRYLMRPATFPRGDSSWETWKLRPLFFFLSFAVAAEPSCEARQIQEASEASALLQTNGPKDVAANLLQTMAPREVRNVLTEAAGFPAIWGESVRIGRESLLFACCLHCGTLVAA